MTTAQDSTTYPIQFSGPGGMRGKMAATMCPPEREGFDTRSLQDIWDYCMEGKMMLEAVASEAGTPESAARRKLIGVMVEIAGIILPQVVDNHWRTILEREVDRIAAWTRGDTGVSMAHLRAIAEAAVPMTRTSREAHCAYDAICLVGEIAACAIAEDATVGARQVWLFAASGIDAVVYAEARPKSHASWTFAELTRKSYPRVVDSASIATQ